MAFSKLVTRIIWPACSTCLSDLVSQKVLVPSLLQSWFIITWLPSMQVFFSNARRAPQDHLYLDFWEWSTWDLQISIGICCSWECLSSALLFFFLCFLLAQFMCSPYTDITKYLLRLHPLVPHPSYLLCFWGYSNCDFSKDPFTWSSQPVFCLFVMWDCHL